MTAEQIQVDLRSAAAKLSEEEIALWAGDQRVFISSAMADLKVERAKVAGAVRTIGSEPVWFEEFGGRDSDAEDAYLGEVASSTIYIGILGRDYGKVLKSHLSATHAEYHEAERSGLRICVWTKAGAEWIAHQQRFVEEVRTFHVTNDFESPEQLADAVRQRLRRLAAEELSPWCKVGPVVFRATRVSDNGTEISVSATLHDPSVVAALEAMRPTFWSGSSHQLTYAGRSRPVEIKGVTTLVQTARATTVELALVYGAQSDDRPTFVSIGGTDYTTDDLIEINLRKRYLARAVHRG